MLQKIIVSLLLKISEYVFRLLFTFIQEQLHKKAIKEVNELINKSSEALSKPETRLQGNRLNEDVFKNLI